MKIVPSVASKKICTISQPLIRCRGFILLLFVVALTAGPARGQTQVQLSDLVGKWRHSLQSSANYVDPHTGAYVGSNTIFYGETYLFKTDMTFTYSFQGMSGGHIIREADSGTWGADGGVVVLKFKGRATEKYKLIGFQGGQQFNALAPR